MTDAATWKQPLEMAVEPAAETTPTEPPVEQADQPDAGPPDDDDAPPQTVENPVFTHRASIADKFKAQRQSREEAIVAAHERAAGDTAHERAAGDTAHERAAGDTEGNEAQQRTEPERRIRVKVRHQQRELSEDELIAAAQKTLAGDGYLEEARRLLEDAKQVASSRPHQGGEDPAHRTNDADAHGNPHQDHDAVLAERIQFGSPDDAKAAIAELRAAATANPDSVRRAVYDTQRVTDVTKAKRSYDRFVETNAELVSDPIAHAAMEAAFYDGVRQDLRNLGYSDDQLPRNTEKLVEAHRFHRIHGQEVRDTGVLLEASKQAVLKFRGGASAEPAPARARDSIAVRVDRTERRAGISPQPARSAIPSPSQGSPQGTQSARSAAVQKMAASGRRLIRT